MPPWKRELDSLVEQTLSFIQSVKGKPVRVEPPAKPSQPVAEQAFDVEQTFDFEQTFDVEQPPPKAPLVPMTWLVSEREEITQRVKTFKAHQQKLQKERDEFFRRTMAHARATFAQPPDGSQAQRDK